LKTINAFVNLLHFARKCFGLPCRADGMNSIAMPCQKLIGLESFNYNLRLILSANMPGLPPNATWQNDPAKRFRKKRHSSKGSGAAQASPV
jgi:hypothetical protein